MTSGLPATGATAPAGCPAAPACPACPAPSALSSALGPQGRVPQRRGEDQPGAMGAIPTPGTRRSVDPARRAGQGLGSDTPTSPGAVRDQVPLHPPVPNPPAPGLPSFSPSPWCRDPLAPRVPRGTGYPSAGCGRSPRYRIPRSGVPPRSPRPLDARFPGCEMSRRSPVPVLRSPSLPPGAGPRPAYRSRRWRRSRRRRAARRGRGAAAARPGAAPEPGGHGPDTHHPW